MEQRLKPFAQKCAASWRTAGNPVSGAKLELWQCNAAGRYAHPNDVATAPLDPDFQGFAAISSGRQGEWRITTIKPAGYESPIGHRTPHIHFDVSGKTHRLITQMYFPGDPLLTLDPIYLGVPDQAARERLVARFDLETTKPEWALGYRFDIVLRGRAATPTQG